MGKSFKKHFSFFLREYTLLFLWTLFLETENKVSVETKIKMCTHPFMLLGEQLENILSC